MPDKNNPKQERPNPLLKGWTHFTKQPVPVSERIELGKQLRKDCPRTSHADWKRDPKGTDPLKLLLSQDISRVDKLVPLRYHRMSQSAFAFFRGSALIMASDLATTASAGPIVQLCGDCHLSNFGIFATPERNVIFDLNDFDETLPGPFEWDIKRLAASFAVAAFNKKYSEKVAEDCVYACISTYRKKMEEFADANSLDVWYQKVDWEHLTSSLKRASLKDTSIWKLSTIKQRGHAGAVTKLTEKVNGKRRIKDNPPLIFHPDDAVIASTSELWQTYVQTLWPSRQCLLQRYRMLDLAAKVVGVGSVGTAAGILLLQGEGGDSDQIILQVKQAVPSVLERFIGRSAFDHCGERIVSGQRTLQSASDLFLGWGTGPKRQFYMRQLMDHKASVPVDALPPPQLEQYAEICGQVLAHAHARSGDPAVIHGYLGKSDAFDEAIAKFAIAYAHQNLRDYASLLAAIKKGTIVTDDSVSGVKF